MSHCWMCVSFGFEFVYLILAAVCCELSGIFVPVCSIPASVSDAASSPPADSAEAGGGAAEGALPLPQH